MGKIIIPNRALSYILFQRTGYLKKNPFFIFLSYFGTIKPFYKLSVSLKSYVWGEKIKKEFINDIKQEFSVIKPFLPQKVSSILDIGCGIAGFDILINRHYNNQVKIFLIDKTGIDKEIYYGFKDKGSIYNSMSLAKSFLEINGVNKNNIFIQEATENNEIKFNENFDIIVSLISWGFHYPISTYIDEVYRKLNHGGILIVDVRKGTKGEDEINKIFGNYKIINESKNFIKVLAIKNV